MALPNGTFNSPNSGVLQVGFSGVWTETNLDTDWSPGGANELWIRGVVDDGTNRLTALIGFQNSTAVLQLDYVGGTNVDVAMSVVSYSFAGISSVSAKKLRIRCCLIKR